MFTEEHVNNPSQDLYIVFVYFTQSHTNRIELSTLNESYIVYWGLIIDNRGVYYEPSST